MKLSVIIPAYNEERTISTIVERVHAVGVDKEIIVIDDGSTDNTKELLRSMAAKQNPVPLITLFHESNRGKGEAVRTGLAAATGDVVVIQDADLEYHPEDYPAALKLIHDGFADAVYGSRFLGPHRCFLFWHYLANKSLTFLTNLLFNTILTDMETGFKLVRTDVMKSLNLRSHTFDLEVELTAKLLKQRRRLYEMPITYTGRGYDEGKKITWKDGVKAVWALLKFRLWD